MVESGFMEMFPSQTIPTHSFFGVKILSEKTAENPIPSSATASDETNQLQDVRAKFKDSFPDAIELGETSPYSRENVDPTKLWCKYRVKVYGASTKPSAFKHIRLKWCGEICKPGEPFWLESLESNSSSYTYKSKKQVHRLPTSSFSLGSFSDRSTFIEHYNANNDYNFVQKEGIVSSFEHDISKLTLTITLKRSCRTESTTKFKVEFQYKQFEDYVVVELNQKNQTIDLYIPLIRPPIVKKEVTDANKDTNFQRCIKFLSCRQEVLGKSSVLRLHYAYSVQEDRGPMELVARLGSQNRKINFAAVLTSLPRNPSEVPIKPGLRNFQADYALECLLSRGYKVTDRVTNGFYEVLQNSLDTHDPPQICRALYQLIAHVDNDRFCNLETKLQQLLYGTFKKNVEIEFEVPKHYAHVPRIIVTPTQNYLVQPELVSENRVIRQYGHEFALRIAFRDEDFNKLMSFGDSLKDVLKTRVVDLLKSGLTICGRHFHFLACSNSQLRDHGAWLFAKGDDDVGVEEIRESLGQLDNIRCVATYVSRMGQCFSSTKESVKVSIPEGVLIKKIPDITLDYKEVKFECCGATRSGTYIFSDGVGKISESLAQKVAESLGLRSTPSAYQIRYGGCKGMLAIDKKIPGGDWRDVVYYRQSMKKFQSEHKDLEICEYSKPNMLYLNRQCITLLSGLGVKDEAFIKLQDAMLMRLASMLLSERVAIDMIGRANVAGGMKTSYLRDSGIVVTREPFFRSMLLAIYKTRLNDLIRKARIAIPQSYGRLMVGVLDETDKLEYGQVFVRYSKEIGGDGTEKEFVTRKGPVMVTKNPCFHPGDMRKLEAVDIPSLNHLVDCIVFPARGPRPHTDEISGSDLDGDKYFVTWYEPFLTPKKNIKPMDFAAPEKKVLDRSVDVNDMIDFIAEYIKNDQLGIIANAHLVHADSEEKGIKSEKCIKLAHMHSDAVDFPKTGKCPSLTPDLRPEQYPDFMMKVDKPRYRSTKVLGKLFQKCKQLERARHFIGEESITPDFKMDHDLILEGHQTYISSAIEKRDYYNTKLGSLMALYGLKNEGEVITGCLMKVGSRLSGKTDERFEVAQLIQASVASLRSKLKEDFYKEFGGQKKIDETFKSKKKYPDKILLKASAWYAVTYEKMASHPAGVPEESANLSRDEWSLSDTPLLSFPWVVARLLAYIKKSVLEKRNKKREQSPSSSKSLGPNDTEMGNIDRPAQKSRKIPSDESGIELRDISEVITTQAENYFFNGGFQEKMVADLEMRQKERDRVYDELCRKSGKSLPPIPILGASLTGLNTIDPHLEPLELYIHVGWKAKEKNQELYLDSIQVDSLKLNGLLSPISQKDLKISIATDPSKTRKTMYVFLHILKCPRLLQLLLVVMHWGRRRHLIGSRQESIMEVEDLAVLFIRFCEMKKHIGKITDLNAQCKKFLSGAGPIEAEENWKDTILKAESHSKDGFMNGTDPGLALIRFLEHYAIDSELDTLHISKIKNVKNPVNPEQVLLPDLNAKKIQRFSDAALHGFHEIAQCRGLDSILKSVEQENKDVQESLTLPRCTWNTIRGAEDFVACGLSELSGAKVNIRQGDRGGQTFMEVHGNYSTLAKCQEERKNLEKKLKGVSVYKSIIDSGCHFVFLGQSSDSNPVMVKQLSEKNFAVNLKGKPSQSGQDEKKLLGALTKQLGEFNKYYITYLHGPRELELTVEYGSIYITDARAWIESGSTVKTIESILTKFTSADMRSNRGKRAPKNHITSKVFFNESRIKPNVLLKDLRKSLTSLGKLSYLQTSENYVVQIKNDKGSDVHLRMIYDKDLIFKRFQFKSFKWLVADLKTHRPLETTSRDIDFRFNMTSRRELEDQKAQELSIYETFAKKEILTAVNGEVKISEAYHNPGASMQLVKVDVYKLDCKGSQIFLDVKTTKEFDEKKPKESSSIGLRACLDSNDIDKARELTRNLLAASKIIGPLIQQSS